MPASSLVFMTQRACLRNLPGITDVGDVPYDILRPILRKITNPQQLHDLETQSPHIADADAELWRAFIARDIPAWQSKLVEPANPRSWWKVYKKLMKEEKRATEEVEERLSAAMGGLSKKREENQAKFVGKVIAQPVTRGPCFVDGVPNPRVNNWGMMKEPSSLKTAKGGRQVLNAIRRQGSSAARDIKRAAGKAEPARYLVPSAKTQIKKAPAWMVQDQRKPAPLAVAKPAMAAARPTPQVFAPKKGPTATDRAIDDAVRSQNVAREARLRALTQPGRKYGDAQPATRPQPQPQPSSTTANPPPSSTPPARPGVPAVQRRIPSPPQAQPLMRKRPAPSASVFMPPKKRKM